MPITWPFSSNAAPPELPGMALASVCRIGVPPLVFFSAVIVPLLSVGCNCDAFEKSLRYVAAAGKALM